MIGRINAQLSMPPLGGVSHQTWAGWAGTKLCPSQVGAKQKWNCIACLLANDEAVTKCIACKAGRGDAQIQRGDLCGNSTCTTPPLASAAGDTATTFGSESAGCAMIGRHFGDFQLGSCNRARSELGAVPNTSSFPARPPPESGTLVSNPIAFTLVVTSSRAAPYLLLPNRMQRSPIRVAFSLVNSSLTAPVLRPSKRVLKSPIVLLQNRLSR